MKKFFSLIALVGAIAACTPEQIQTAFELAGGKVLVTVEVVDIINGGTYNGPIDIKFIRGGQDVTGEFSPVVGNEKNTYMWQADMSKPIVATDYEVWVDGDHLAKTYTSKCVVPNVLAGGEATIKVIVPVGEPSNDYTLMVVEPEEEEVKEWEEYGYLANSHYQTHAYSHAGIDEWYYNNTEFAIPGEAEYTWESVGATSNKVDNQFVGFEDVVKNVEDALLEASKWAGDTETYPFTVSAYAMWQVVQTEYHQKFPVRIIAFKDANKDEKYDEGEEKLDLGSFDFEYVYSNLIEMVEIAYPGAAGHFTPGHGRDAHGTMPNAGGGVSFNE